jgi:hypothetical protein
MPSLGGAFQVDFVGSSMQLHARPKETFSSLDIYLSLIIMWIQHVSMIYHLILNKIKNYKYGASKFLDVSSVSHHLKSPTMVGLDAKI